MPLLGKAILAIWNGIAKGADDEFESWHVREHIPERVGLPVSLRGRRYAARLRRQLDGAYKADKGLVGMHLLRGQPRASRRDTAEIRLRSGQDTVASWVLLVEAADPVAVTRFLRAAGSKAELGTDCEVKLRGSTGCSPR